MKIFFASLGCDKNLSDSEHMLYLLSKEGWEITSDESAADVIIINTCCFIESALQESINTVLSLAPLKTEGNCKALLVTGCMAERYKEQIRDELPEVDGILGTNSYDEIVEAVKEVLAGKEVLIAKPLSGLPGAIGGRILSTGGHFAYLKIAEGCDKHCTYCVIPKIRGGYRSIPMEELLSEAERLVEGGVRELILVAQETVIYGEDLTVEGETGKRLLPRLLQELSKLPDLQWIRILYCYPEDVDDELLFEMQRNPKVVPYLDIPIQHASDGVLKRMGRRTDREELRRKIKRIREILPDITLRTTVILGFPGEREEDVEELLSFMEEMRFDRLGAFAYSREEDTPAYSMPDQIPEDVKNERVERVMELQQRITFEKNEELVGRDFQVLVEGYLPEDEVYVGRTYRDAPDVDGLIFISGLPFEPVSGQILPVSVTSADGYDLLGTYHPRQ